MDGWVIGWLECVLDDGSVLSDAVPLGPGRDEDRLDHKKRPPSASAGCVYSLSTTTYSQYQ